MVVETVSLRDRVDQVLRDARWFGYTVATGDDGVVRVRLVLPDDPDLDLAEFVDTRRIQLARMIHDLTDRLRGGTVGFVADDEAVPYLTVTPE